MCLCLVGSPFTALLLVSVPPVQIMLGPLLSPGTSLILPTCSFTSSHGCWSLSPSPITISLSSSLQVGQSVGKDAFAPFGQVDPLSSSLDPQRRSHGHRSQTLLLTSAVQPHVDPQNPSSPLQTLLLLTGSVKETTDWCPMPLTIAPRAT